MADPSHLTDAELNERLALALGRAVKIPGGIIAPNYAHDWRHCGPLVEECEISIYYHLGAVVGAEVVQRDFGKDKTLPRAICEVALVLLEHKNG